MTRYRVTFVDRELHQGSVVVEAAHRDEAFRSAKKLKDQGKLTYSLIESELHDYDIEALLNA